jgi:hypothetical protein
MLNTTSEGMKKEAKARLFFLSRVEQSSSHFNQSFSQNSNRSPASQRAPKPARSITKSIMGPAKPFFFAPFTPPPLTPPIQRPSERQRRRQRLPLTGRLPHCITLHASGTVQFKYTHPEREGERKRESYHPFKLTCHSSFCPSHPRASLPSQIRPQAHKKSEFNSSQVK